jgi:hypothetical protein
LLIKVTDILVQNNMDRRLVNRQAKDITTPDITEDKTPTKNIEQNLCNRMPLRPDVEDVHEISEMDVSI